MHSVALQGRTSPVESRRMERLLVFTASVLAFELCLLLLLDLVIIDEFV